MPLVLLLAGLLVPAGSASVHAATSEAVPINRPHCDGMVVASSNDAPPFGVTPCAGVRPGGIVHTPSGGFCTLGFLFKGTALDGAGVPIEDADGETVTEEFIATAGHCVVDVGREQTWDKGSGPSAVGHDGQQFGEFAYAIHQGARDFALVRLDPTVEWNPQMCHFGGPTGVAGLQPNLSPVVLQHYGHGTGVGKVPARSGVAIGMPHPQHVHAQLAAFLGDSGSPVTTSDGLAVGLLVTVGAHMAGFGTTGIDAGSAGIARLQPQVERAGSALLQRLELLTAELL